jgi:hypothetical protein
MDEQLLLPALGSGIAAFAGSVRGIPSLTRYALVVLVLVTVAGGVGLAISFEPHTGVTRGGVIGGAVVGGVGGVTLPLVAYFAIGRSLSANVRSLIVVWVVSQVPLYVYLFAVFFFSADLFCGPDSYECPL